MEDILARSADVMSSLLSFRRRDVTAVWIGHREPVCLFTYSGRRSGHRLLSVDFSRLLVIAKSSPEAPSPSHPHSIKPRKNLPGLPQLSQHRLPPLLLIPPQPNPTTILLHTMQKPLTQARLRTDINPLPLFDTKVNAHSSFATPINKFVSGMWMPGQIRRPAP